MRVPLGCLLRVGFLSFQPSPGNSKRTWEQPAHGTQSRAGLEGGGSYRRGRFRGRHYVEIFKRRGAQ